ncbi:MAG: hypothetical protein P1U70_02255 [Saprospiraceae bacterium]|jgi:hypothetical protein|nr:hypothetical protein [Saprospiraceae bacterium]
MAGTTFNKPRSLQHAKTIHRPLISYVCVEQATLAVEAGDFIFTTELSGVLQTAGRNNTPVPYQRSSDIDTEGVVVLEGKNRVLVYQNGSQNVLNDSNGEEIYGRIAVMSGGGFALNFYTLNNHGVEQRATLPTGDYDFFIPYRFSFEKLPDDALIRVKSKRVSDDPIGGGGREVMQIVEITGINAAAPLAFMPIPGSFVWGHVDGHSVDSLPRGAFSMSGKDIIWDVAMASYDLEPSDRFVVHYETYDLETATFEAVTVSDSSTPDMGAPTTSGANLTSEQVETVSTSENNFHYEPTPADLPGTAGAPSTGTETPVNPDTTGQ